MGDETSETGWDRTRRDDVLTSPHAVDVVVERIRSRLKSEGWTVSAATPAAPTTPTVPATPATPQDPASSTAPSNPGGPAPARSGDEDLAGGDQNRPAPVKIAARRAMSRAAQLVPADDAARRLLGLWSLKDHYPPNVSRGGCILATFDYGLMVRVRPADGGCEVEVECHEIIAPFKGSFPDPTRFSIASEIDAVDPVGALRDAMGSPHVITSAPPE